MNRSYEEEIGVIKSFFRSHGHKSEEELKAGEALLAVAFQVVILPPHVQTIKKFFQHFEIFPDILKRLNLEIEMDSPARKS